jgi:hypothetical protein
VTTSPVNYVKNVLNSNIIDQSGCNYHYCCGSKSRHRVVLHFSYLLIGLFIFMQPEFMDIMMKICMQYDIKNSQPGLL